MVGEQVVGRAENKIAGTPREREKERERTKVTGASRDRSRAKSLEGGGQSQLPGPAKRFQSILDTVRPAYCQFIQQQERESERRGSQRGQTAGLGPCSSWNRPGLHDEQCTDCTI